MGITPVEGFTPYVSYAEGYRAPSITETLLTGAHVGPNPYAGLFYCPSGTYPPPGPPVFNLNLFCFLPNLNLRPEVGKNKEAGINLKYNNIFGAGDSFRGKFNVFRNDLEDYIELTQFGPPRTYQGNALLSLLSISEHPVGTHPGLRSRDDVRCGCLVRRRFRDPVAGL